MSERVNMGGRGAVSSATKETAIEKLQRISAEIDGNGHLDDAGPDVVEQVINDPLLDRITAYRIGNVAFEAVKEADWPLHGGEEAVIAKTYGPPMEVLANWDAPATSMKGAVEALKIIRDESLVASGIADNMLAAALAYLEGELGEESNTLAVSEDRRLPDHLDSSIEDAYNARALLDVATRCARDVSENAERPHNEMFASLSRLMEVVNKQVGGCIDALEIVEMNFRRPHRRVAASRRG